MIYDYSLNNRHGDEISLKTFKGKVLLIVNTATGCGFTPQYKDLQTLYDNYHDVGLEIIDIPCNQFNQQAPGSDEDIYQFCQLNYQTLFEQMAKSDVNGDNALPLYTFLKSQQGFKGFGIGPKALAMSAFLKTLDSNYKNTPDIKWNFTKFLVARDGEVVARFEPTISMKTVEKAIKDLL